MEDRARLLAVGMGALRTVVGSLALFVPEFGLKLFGFPKEHDTPTTRMFAKLFGLRNVLLGLGIITTATLRRDRLRTVALANAALDAADVVVLAEPLVRRQGVDRAAAMAAAAGLAACTGFVAVAREA